MSMRRQYASAVLSVKLQPTKVVFLAGFEHFYRADQSARWLDQLFSNQQIAFNRVQIRLWVIEENEEVRVLTLEIDNPMVCLSELGSIELSN